MEIKCPNCDHVIEQVRPPAKNDPSAGDAWICFKCPAMVCIHCYIQHNEKVHPEVYAPPLPPTKGGKKKKKGKKK